MLYLHSYRPRYNDALFVFVGICTLCNSFDHHLQAAEVLKFHNEIEGLRINFKISQIEECIDSGECKLGRKYAKRHAFRCVVDV
jgi:hypothetical protein